MTKRTAVRCAAAALLAATVLVLGMSTSQRACAEVLTPGFKDMLKRQAQMQPTAPPAMSEPAIYNKTGVAKWTVMVYLSGNNNLAPDMLRVVNEMEQTGSNPDMQLVAHIARDSKQLSQDMNPGIATPDDKNGGSFRYHVTKDDSGAITSLPVPVSGDPGKVATLLGFIKWAKKAYPAERYMLVIYGHGAGMMGTSASDAAGGGSVISMPELQQALKLTGGVDVLFFYSCLMQMAEVSARLQGEAGVVLGSETSMLSGLPLGPLFKTIKKNASLPAEEMGAAMFKAVGSADPRVMYGDEMGAPFSLSLVRPGGMKTLLPAMEAFVEAVMSENAIDAASAARDQAMRVFPAQEDSIYQDYCDLGDFVMLTAQLSSSGRVRAAAEGLMAALNGDYLVKVAKLPIGDSAYTNGVSVYLPQKGHKMLSKANYGGNPLGASRWGAFLAWLNMDRAGLEPLTEKDKDSFLSKDERYQGEMDNNRREEKENCALDQAADKLDRADRQMNPEAYALKDFQEDLLRQDSLKKKEEMEKIKREAERMRRESGRKAKTNKK